VPTGTKLNIGIQHSSGDVIQKLDDDDYYHPDFLKLALARLPSQPSERTLVAWDCFLILFGGESKLLHSGHGWEAGGTFCFYRKLWQRKPFRNVAKNEDYWFIYDHRPRIRRVCAAEQYIVVRHGRNTWTSIGGHNVDAYLRAMPPYEKLLESLVPAEDAAFYRSLIDAGPKAKLGV
jgi:glycosyltransferase involved in cell wall biosynthesis